MTPCGIRLTTGQRRACREVGLLAREAGAAQRLRAMIANAINPPAMRIFLATITPSGSRREEASGAQARSIVPWISVAPARLASSAVWTFNLGIGGIDAKVGRPHSTRSESRR